MSIMKKRYKAMLEEVAMSTSLDDIIGTLTSIATQKSNLQDIEDDSNEVETSSDEYEECEEYVLAFLSRLEGYSTRIKECHWSAEHMATHKLCDDVRESLINYEDQIAEDFQGIIGFRIKVGSLKPVMPESNNIKDLLNELYKNVSDLYDILSARQNKLFNGIINILDDMIHTINTFAYLSTFK